MKEGYNRREFLKKTSAAMLSALAAGAPVSGLLSSCGSPTMNATADSVILLFMAGGMAHTETFDPKNSLLSEKEWNPKRYSVHFQASLQLWMEFIFQRVWNP
ncbi:DUF1501 domain-containing protein [Algoriphagus halophilus]|uniref:DUF1501 domain-containing protein n=1 Tax=Algoriphagus halophilus TaxID=226505 RepID=UPI00358EF0F8